MLTSLMRSSKGKHNLELSVLFFGLFDSLFSSLSLLSMGALFNVKNIFMLIV